MAWRIIPRPMEARARAEEQKRLLSHEVEVKRLEAERKQIPKWLIAVIALVVIGGTSGGIYYKVKSDEERAIREREALAREEALIKQFEEQKRLLQASLDKATQEEEKVKAALSEAEASGNAEAIAAAKAQLKAARKKTLRARRARRSAKKKDKEDAPAAKPRGGLSDDPLGGLDL